ncbi:RNAse HI domain-containing protein [Brevibacterium sp. 91QC2O2]|uniref:ribonuclease H family protein n=1 Tax=Brevibacterium TaxID=1696 RepID=UPI00211CF446|nr:MULTISPECIES: ribonuclease H family protein [unclassified Brevibacterium]MCQ9369595.1 RNAse HI domain-containing protein [Brevibacterium sp. 91QC2O2]MCQ9387020.1 RNAse HI domain-containing protein [Brevibacterium sp. 68QC2CO]
MPTPHPLAPRQWLSTQNPTPPPPLVSDLHDPTVTPTCVIMESDQTAGLLLYVAGTVLDGGLRLDLEFGGSGPVDELPTIWDHIARAHPGRSVIIACSGFHSTAVHAACAALAVDCGLPVDRIAQVSARARSHLFTYRPALCRAGATLLNVAELDRRMAELATQDADPGQQPRIVRPPTSWQPALHSRDYRCRGSFDTVYTDGSLIHFTGQGAGCALASDGRWVVSPVANAHNPLHAELEAVYNALCLSLYSDAPRITIVTDSQQTVQLLQMEPRMALRLPWLDSWNNTVLRRAHRLLAHGPAQISLRWTRGHNGDPLNEACDRVARFVARARGWDLLGGVTASRVEEIIADEVRSRGGD